MPILISDLNSKNLKEITNVLYEYFDDPKNLFIFSTDFCHWGNHF